MIQFKLNSKPVLIPSHWDDVTFKQYCKILKMRSDPYEAVSIFASVDTETLKKTTATGIDKVFYTLSFLSTVPEIPGYTDKVGKYRINTKNGRFAIEFESNAQFKDMRRVMSAIPVKEGKCDIHGLTKSYSHFVAFHLQQIRDGKYNHEAAKQMIPEVEEMPALEVISLGSFFFAKLMKILKISSLNSLN